jgi:hypothetical protein
VAGVGEALVVALATSGVVFGAEEPRGTDRGLPVVEDTRGRALPPGVSGAGEGVRIE